MSQRTRPPALLSDRAALIAIGVLALACIALLGAEFVYTRHPYFGFDGFPGLYPVAGFATVIVAVLVARLLRPMIGRGENYYGEADPEIAILDTVERPDE